MKKLLLSMLVLMTAATASAQWAVADAPNLAQNVKNFSELQKQVGYLKEQKDRLDETLDMMRKVNSVIYNPQIQISAESETKRSIFREKDKTKRSKKESAQHSKSRNKSFVMTSVSAL